ncbi:MAG: TonB-dependent receptor [Flavobacteriaceae bacterium]
MKKTASLITVFFMAFLAQAQLSLRGTVTELGNFPIADVNILNIANGSHGHSNDKGFFMMENIRRGDTLQLSHLGYETQMLVVRSLNDHLNLVLEAKSISLEEVVISPRIDALNLITDIDIKTNPVASSQEILRQVPGMFIGQHAGGGKAEQIFLRGFDLDHGTDIGITVDGLPVNMVSHAHGQGYADLHFVIPETVNNIDFGKGPYYAEHGNFNTAGYVDLRTKEQLEQSLIKLEVGDFNTQRLLGMFNLLQLNGHHAYIASEHLATDGPFESPQNFNRINLMGKYSGNLTPTDKIGVTASHFYSRWDASGQIPQRAVDAGLIGRFGAIDDTEGGSTGRTNLLVTYHKYLDDRSLIKNSVFYSNYQFGLFSNFTFFLNDPLNGDQILQKEDRDIYGLKSEYQRSFSADKLNGNWQIGFSFRADRSFDNELSGTRNRTETLNPIQRGDISETNLGAYVGSSINIGKFTINPSLRFDRFNFQYRDALIGFYQTQTESRAIVSPKFNVLYSPSSKIQLYAKAGKGFHSNDTRVVVAQKGKEILPAAYGFDLGFIWKPLPRLLVNAAYWYLFLEQEFVYVGDAGIVEPSGKTKRLGIDLSMRYQPLDWLFWNFDTNYTHARALEEPSGADYIPLAPDFTIVSGLNAIHPSGFYGGANLRYLKDRPANEDNSIIAEGYTVLDLNIGYEWKNFDFSLQIQNLFDTQWNETQFATESRLQNETVAIEEIHFTPGIPFFIKQSISYRF